MKTTFLGLLLFALAFVVIFSLGLASASDVIMQTQDGKRIVVAQPGVERKGNYDENLYQYSELQSILDLLNCSKSCEMLSGIAVFKSYGKNMDVAKKAYCVCVDQAIMFNGM